MATKISEIAAQTRRIHSARESGEFGGALKALESAVRKFDAAISQAEKDHRERQKETNGEVIAETLTKIREDMIESNKMMVDVLRQMVEAQQAEKFDVNLIVGAISRGFENAEAKTNSAADEKRDPVSYHATIERNSRGAMTGVMLKPVV